MDILCFSRCMGADPKIKEDFKMNQLKKETVQNPRSMIFYKNIKKEIDKEDSLL